MINSQDLWFWVWDIAIFLMGIYQFVRVCRLQKCLSEADSHRQQAYNLLREIEGFKEAVDRRSEFRPAVELTLVKH